MKYRNQKNAAAVAAFWGKPLEQRDWYSIKALDHGEAEIRIYDVIGWPFIEASDFLRALDNIEADTITLRINSPGGDVFDGTAIYNAIKEHPARFVARIEGIAASMASVIALAADDVQIAKSAYYMIHNAWSIAFGDYRDISATAQLLERMSGNLGQIYAEKTGKPIADIRQLMDDETWYIGQEAVAAGFADQTTTQASATARFDLSMYAHAPDTAVQATKRDLERVLMQDAGLTRSQARDVLNHGYPDITRDADEGDINRAQQLIQTLTRV